jgi:Putative MetA-pathway of phenol degradation
MRSRTAKIVLGVGLALAVPALTLAQDFSGLPDPLVTDRPDFTESTSIIPRGHFQIEGGYTFTRQGDEDASSLGELLLRVGAGERVEARFGIGSYGTVDPGVPGSSKLSGYEDPFIGVKIGLNASDPELLPPGRPQMALLLSTSVPVGSDELTSDEWQPEGKLALGWDLTDFFSLSSNLIYGYPSDGDERYHQFGATLSAGFSLTDRLGAFVEAFGFNKESLNGSSTTYLDSGLAFRISNDIQLDVRVGAGLDDPSPNWFAGLGGGVRF